VKYCPKCEGAIYPNFTLKMCHSHQKKYDDWLNKPYSPEVKCKCGSDQYIDGFLQMTSPPSFPEEKVYRSAKCNEMRCEVADDSEVRIMVRR